jgi:hypothetical protein
MVAKSPVKLLEYNAFGLVTIQRERISASLTAISDQRSLTRTVREEVLIEDIDKGETIIVTLGAWVGAGKTRISVHEIGSEKYDYLMAQIPQVRSTIEKVAEMIKNGAKVD